MIKSSFSSITITLPKGRRSEEKEQENSVQFCRSVMSDSLRPHELQYTRPPCPSSTPGVHPNSCALSQWRHPAISSSVVPFSSCPQSLQASGSFPMSQLFAWGGQIIGVSASAGELDGQIISDTSNRYREVSEVTTQGVADSNSET